MRLHLGRQTIAWAGAVLLFGAAAGQLHAQSTSQGTEHANPAPNSQLNSKESPAAHQHDGMPGMHHDGSMPGMNMEDDTGNHAQAGAMKSMTHGHHMDSAHMLMTPDRPATDEDRRRADQISATLAQAIEKIQGLSRRPGGRLSHLRAQSPAGSISLFELLEWIPGGIHLRSRAAYIASLQKD